MVFAEFRHGFMTSYSFSMRLSGFFFRISCMETSMKLSFFDASIIRLPTTFIVVSCVRIVLLLCDLVDLVSNFQCSLMMVCVLFRFLAISC